jgi:uncharacterized protein YdhG (YjbR/CyaY superfamily)
MAKSDPPATPPATVDECISHTPEPGRSMLAQMRAAIRAALPKQAVEVISYRMPAFRLNKVLVWYAAFKDHCSLFPTGQVIGQFKSELVAYKISKGTAQFPFDKPLPAALIKKLVKARLQMVEEESVRRKRSG